MSQGEQWFFSSFSKGAPGEHPEKPKGAVAPSGAGSQEHENVPLKGIPRRVKTAVVGLSFSKGAPAELRSNCTRGTPYESPIPALIFASAWNKEKTKAQRERCSKGRKAERGISRVYSLGACSAAVPAAHLRPG
jgi:hypothetical protein